MANLPTLTIEQALSNLMEKAPAEYAVINAAVKKDIVVLGSDQAFALRDGDGDIRAFKQSLTLTLADGELVQPVYNGPYVISAQGYEKYAEATGTSVIFPKEVLVDGQWQPNPAVVRDPANRRILCIYARAVAFKYSSKGIPMVVDRTTIFDTPSYRLIDLLGKAKKFPQAFKLLPSEMGKPEDKGTWAAYPFDESTNLWVNTSHEESLTWYAQIMNREKKAMELAQTFSARNALKHISGLQKAPGPVWTIPILCWRPTGKNIVKWDSAQYAALQENVGQLSISCGAGFETGKTVQIECKTGKERVSDETGFDVLENNEDIEDQQHVIDIAVPPETAPPVALPETIAGDSTSQTAPLHPAENEMSADDQATMNNLAVAMQDFEDEYKAACKILRIKPNGKHQPYEARIIMQKINEEVDRM